MTPTEVITTPLLMRALVLGLFGGAGLALTAIYSRRGPLIYPVYAAFLAALGLLLARHAALAFATRAASALSAFLIASAVLYVTVAILARDQRRRLVAEGELRESALHAHLSIWGHIWRMGFLAIVGGVVSSALAFISS